MLSEGSKVEAEVPANEREVMVKPVLTKASRPLEGVLRAVAHVIEDEGVLRTFHSGMWSLVGESVYEAPEAAHRSWERAAVLLQTVVGLPTGSDRWRRVVAAIFAGAVDWRPVLEMNCEGDPGEPCPVCGGEGIP